MFAVYRLLFGQAGSGGARSIYHNKVLAPDKKLARGNTERFYASVQYTIVLVLVDGLFV